MIQGFITPPRLNETRGSYDHRVSPNPECLRGSEISEEVSVIIVREKERRGEKKNYKLYRFK